MAVLYMSIDYRDILQRKILCVRTLLAMEPHTLHTSTYCGDYAYYIQDKVYSFNLQQQNASRTRSNFLTDLELEVEYLTWYGVINVASAWHVHVVL